MIADKHLKMKAYFMKIFVFTNYNYLHHPIFILEYLMNYLFDLKSFLVCFLHTLYNWLCLLYFLIHFILQLFLFVRFIYLLIHFSLKEYQILFNFNNCFLFKLLLLWLNFLLQELLHSTCLRYILQVYHYL